MSRFNSNINMYPGFIMPSMLKYSNGAEHQPVFAGHPGTKKL